jgi:hypothetical protein
MMSVNYCHQWAYSLSRYMSMDNHSGMILTGENPKNSEKNLSQCPFVHNRSHMD